MLESSALSICPTALPSPDLGKRRGQEDRKKGWSKRGTAPPLPAPAHPIMAVHKASKRPLHAGLGQLGTFPLALKGILDDCRVWEGPKGGGLSPPPASPLGALVIPRPRVCDEPAAHGQGPRGPQMLPRSQCNKITSFCGTCLSFPFRFFGFLPPHTSVCWPCSHVRSALGAFCHLSVSGNQALRAVCAGKLRPHSYLIRNKEVYLNVLMLYIHLSEFKKARIL